VQYNHDRLVIVKRLPEKYSLFSSRQNVVSDGAFLTDDGRLFYAWWEAQNEFTAFEIACAVAEIIGNLISVSEVP